VTTKLGVCAALCLLTFSTSTFAGEANVQKAGVFFGLGVSYNSVNFDQDLFAVGISDVFNPGGMVASGFAAGPAAPFSDTLSGIAREAQLGYFSHFAASSWLWGIKFRYRHVGMTSTQRDVIVPQVGAYVDLTTNPPTTSTLAGNVFIQSSKTDINHELALLAFLGHSFANSNVYLGAGPVVFGTKSSINRAAGFASVMGVPVDITGPPASFFSSKWMWGGAAQIGMTHYFAPSWFLDFNYTYAMTGRNKTDYSAPFTSTTGNLTYVGTAYITTWHRIISQSFAVSINKVF
jgi:hypothetical protein